MEDNGFEVESVNKNNMKGIKDKYGVPSNLQSCHTAVVDDYVIEGHVPTAGVLKLVSKKRHIKGLAPPVCHKVHQVWIYKVQKIIIK